MQNTPPASSSVVAAIDPTDARRAYLQDAAEKLRALSTERDQLLHAIQTTVVRGTPALRFNLENTRTVLSPVVQEIGAIRHALVANGVPGWELDLYEYTPHQIDYAGVQPGDTVQLTYLANHPGWECRGRYQVRVYHDPDPHTLGRAEVVGADEELDDVVYLYSGRTGLFVSEEDANRGFGWMDEHNGAGENDVWDVREIVVYARIVRAA